MFHKTSTDWVYDCPKEELDTLELEYGLPRWFYTSGEWAKYGRIRLKLVEEVRVLGEEMAVTKQDISFFSV